MTMTEKIRLSLEIFEEKLQRNDDINTSVLLIVKSYSSGLSPVSSRLSIHRIFSPQTSSSCYLKQPSKDKT